jgi:hypothetical protein
MDNERVQVQLLQELVGTSRKMGAHAASTRHMAFLLQVLELYKKFRLLQFPLKIRLIECRHRKKIDR